MLINKIKRTLKKQSQYKIIKTSTKEPTCTESGSWECYCTLCENTYTEPIPPLGHNYNDGIVIQEPTCIESGIKTYTCTRCNDSYTETIAALGHDYASDFTIDKEPTCTTSGSKSKHCSRCDSKTDITSISVLGHNYGAWKIITPATCTTTGIKQRTCSRCGTIDTDIIPITEHNFVNGTCTNCGNKDPNYTDDTSLSPGFYNSNNELLISWDNAVATYGLDAESDYWAEDTELYVSDTKSPSYILTHHFPTATKIILTKLGN